MVGIQIPTVLDGFQLCNSVIIVSNYLSRFVTKNSQIHLLQFLKVADEMQKKVGGHNNVNFQGLGVFVKIEL